jgi:glucosamine-6-phosphate deaminase
MGVRTILDARRVVLLAFGESKATIIRRALTEEISPALPATYLGAHPEVSFYLDEAAARELR